MKYNKIIPVVAMSALFLASCDDQKMEWYDDPTHGKVTTAELPLQLAEQIKMYKNIKEYAAEYAAEYAPNMIVGLGMGADLYMSDPDYKKVCDENFQMYTTGNAMKHASVVNNKGELVFTTIDAFFEAIPADMPVYGHNFIWHTQQRASYLNGLIAPEVIIEPDTDGKIENILTNSDFEAGNITGWGAWSSAGCKAEISEKGKGYNSDYAMKLTNPAAGDSYSAQAYYTLPISTWEVGATYIYSLYVYSEEGNNKFQMQMQNRTTYSGDGYQEITVPAGKWTYFEKEFVMTQAMDDLTLNHLVINFGSATGVYYIDNIKFGKKKEGPTNYCTNGSFENGTTGWTLQNKGAGMEVVELADAPAGSHVMKMTASASSVNEYDLQLITGDLPVLTDKKVQISFYIKADQEGEGRLSFSNMSNNYPYMDWTGSQSSWTKSFTVGTTWQNISVIPQNFNSDFAQGATTWKVNFDLGFKPDVTYYLDDVQITVYEEAPVVKSEALAQTRAGGITYIEKTDEEKKEIITDAMEAWIKGMMEHCKSRVTMWDVLNEPVTDGNKLRGVEDIPEEQGDQEFYWGQYMGKEYAVKAFQFARQYGNSTDKLFINDYNLEVSPNKLAKLIEYVKYIDDTNGAPIVDGIGTQMHLIASSITRKQIDDMFITMAATGKLIRVTELDVRVETLNPTFEQLELQANVYQMVVESYKANVPSAQQSGITIWSLTDAPREHEYWFPDDVPNLFEKNYARKYSYKGFCDGLAGKDIGMEFSGDDWKKAYDK